MRLSLRCAAVVLLATLALAAVPASAEPPTGSSQSSPAVGFADGLGDRLAAIWVDMIRFVLGDDGDQTPGSEIDPNGRGVRGR